MHNLVLSPIDPELLINSIATKVTADLVAAIYNQAPPPRIVDDATLGQELDVTRQTLGRWRKQNRIPFMQVGSVIRYDFNKVIEALEKKKGGRS